MTSPVTETVSLPQRPKRADAARNYDKLIAAAREAFTDDGADASLEGIARRAGVGIGTLYRNFPTRQALLEAVYVDEVNAVCQAADDLGDREPWDALVTWLRSFAAYAQTKHALMGELMAYMGTDAETFRQCRGSLLTAGTPLLDAAKEAGVVRQDVEAMDMMRM